jgi:hypothetical protein
MLKDMARNRIERFLTINDEFSSKTNKIFTKLSISGNWTCPEFHNTAFSTCTNMCVHVRTEYDMYGKKRCEKRK